jgi:hypothetical protein
VTQLLVALPTSTFAVLASLSFWSLDKSASLRKQMEIQIILFVVVGGPMVDGMG